MSSYHYIAAGTTERFFTVVARADGSPITSGTVNYYLKALSGLNAGKWFRNSDQTWQASETANAMTHHADGHWGITLASSPFADGVRYLEYVKESGNLHVPDARHLVGKTDYLDAAISSRSNHSPTDVRDLILSDATPFPGARIDAAISSRSSHSPTDVRDAILSDATPFAGANIDAAITSRAAPGDAMTLTAQERVDVANEVETQIIDETDAEKVLQAITDKIAEANPDLSGLTLSAIAAAVWDHLLTAITQAGSIGKLLKDNIDAQISTRSSHSPTDVRDAILSDATPFAGANIDAAISTRSTFDAANDNVTVGSMTQAALAQFVTDDTGETTAAPGSVAQLAQLGGDAEVTVDSFSQTALNQLAASKAIHVSVPTLVGNQLSQPIVQGDSYLAAHGRAIEFSRSDFPDLAGSEVVTLSARRVVPATSEEVSFTIAGSVAVATGTKVVRFEPTSAQTRAWEPGKYEFDVEVQFPDGNVATFVGPGVFLRVVEDVTDN